MSEKMQVIEAAPEVMRTFEDLTDQEKEFVMKKVEALDYKDSAEVIQFGTEVAQDLGEFTSSLFKGFNVSNFEDFDSTILTLMTNLKTVDTKSLAKKQESSWEKFPVIGPMFKKNVVDSVNETIMKHTSIEKVVEEIVTKLEQTKFEAIKDMKLSLEMREKTYRLADDHELNFLVIEKAKEAAEAEKAEIEARYNPDNLRDVNELSDISNAITSLEQRATAIQVYRVMSLQNLPKLTYIHNAKQAIATKIQDAIVNVVPHWKQEFALAILTFRIRNSAYVLENVRMATEEIYKQGGVMLREAMLSTAKEIEALPVSMEALEQVNNQMIELCEELTKIEADAKQARKEALPELRKLQQSILNIEAKKKEV